MKKVPSALVWIVCGIVAGTTASAVAGGEPAQRTVTSTSKPPSAATPKSIEERLAALEKRVEDLENGDIEDLRDDKEDEAREKKLESRLAALEKARATETRTEDGTSGSTFARGNSGPLTVRAPFIVQNASGDTILEVGIATENGQPELMLGDRTGGRVRLGVTRAGGASLGLYDRNGSRVALVGNPAESLFRVGGKGPAVDIAARAAGTTLHISNAMDHAVVSLQSRNEHGHFTLGNAEGETTVEAATLRDSGVGVVRVGPDMGGTSGAMAGGVVVPRAIRGRRAGQ